MRDEKEKRRNEGRVRVTLTNLGLRVRQRSWVCIKGLECKWILPVERHDLGEWKYVILAEDFMASAGENQRLCKDLHCAGSVQIRHKTCSQADAPGNPKRSQIPFCLLAGTAPVAVAILPVSFVGFGAPGESNREWHDISNRELPHFECRGQNGTLWREKDRTT